jgi:predicted acyltransferase
MASIAALEISAQSSSIQANKPERLLSLDVFRGLTVAAMILVTDPGTYSAIYWPLRHSDWNGWTPTDMIAPAFLFIIGVAFVFASASRMARGETRGRLARHLLQRSAILVAIGLVMNEFPHFHLHTWRIPGILQRIAVNYALGGLLYLALLPKADTADHLRRRVMVIGAVTVALVAGYWLLLRYFPVPGFGPDRLDTLGNLSGYVDRAVFTTRHMWAYGTTPGHGVTYDPDGLLVALPATANLLVGILAGDLLRTKSSAMRKVMVMAVAGAVLFVAGRALHPLMPINKKIYTGTYVLLSAGFSLMAFAVAYWVLDVQRWRRWARPLTVPGLVFGTNAILAFAVSTMITASLDAIHVYQGKNMHHWLYEKLFLPWLSPVNSSLAYALAIVGVNFLIIGVFYRRRIFLRV